jgi:DNA-binding transcriptional MocR family regulator
VTGAEQAQALLPGALLAPGDIAAVEAPAYREH